MAAVYSAQRVAGAAVFGLSSGTQSAASISGAGGIASGEAFGVPTVTIPAAQATISGAGGIPSGEAFGVPAVSIPGSAAVITEAGGIASGEAFGVPVVTIPDSIGTIDGTVLALLLAKVTDLHRVHGLEAGAPLVVTQTTRIAGTISQTVAESNGTVTVSRV